MTKHATALLLWLYEDHVNGVYPQEVEAEALGMTRNELIQAGKRLKSKGFFPGFNLTVQGSGGEKNIFFWKMKDEDIN